MAKYRVPNFAGTIQRCGREQAAYQVKVTGQVFNTGGTHLFLDSRDRRRGRVEQDRVAVANWANHVASSFWLEDQNMVIGLGVKRRAKQ